MQREREALGDPGRIHDRACYALQRGPSFTHAGRLLEGVRELQHAEIVAVAADDLQTDRQPVVGEPAGHRDRRAARDA